MTEFGHRGIILPGICIDTWGAGPFVIEVGAQTFRFEDSDRFGPLFVGKTGRELENQMLAERSPFWAAHRAWVSQGRRLKPDGTSCIWDQPKPTTFRKIKRGFAVVVEHGDEDGGFVEVCTDSSSLNNSEVKP
jgi:hypothetical protein